MPLSVPCAVVGWREHMPPSKGTRVTTNMNFVRRSKSPLSSGRLYKTPVLRRRLSHAHRKVDRGQRGEAASARSIRPVAPKLEGLFCCRREWHVKKVTCPHSLCAAWLTSVWACSQGST